MWTSQELGLANWHANDGDWQFDARGGDVGISLKRDDASDDFSICPVADDRLPSVGEQYIRGNRLQLNFPQGDGRFALRLALEPVESTAKTLVFQATISIQTSLLDSHPMVDLVADGQSVEAVDPGKDDVDSPFAALTDRAAGAPAIAMAKSEGLATAILLDHHDHPYTTDHSADGQLRLRLFGDFLEKGVIRTARPWIVATHAEPSDLQARLVSWHARLCESPLPLS